MRQRRSAAGHRPGQAVSLLVVLAFLATGCAAFGGDRDDDVAGEATSSATVTDSLDREVRIEQPVERVAILDSGSADVMRSLGVLDTLVGSHEALAANPYWEEIHDVPVVATYSEISFEALAEAKPQLVLSSVSDHGSVGDNELLDDLQIADVKVSLRRPELMKNEVMLLGTIFGEEDKAEELVDFYTEVEEQIADTIADVPESERPTVFVEYHAGDFATGGPGSRFYEQVALAGGRNIAAEITDERQVSAEFVAEADPEFIIRETSGVLGYAVESTADAEPVRNEILERSGLQSVQAVENGDVYLLPTDLYSRPAYIAGIAYLAQWFYPERFDADFGEQVHREYVERFHPGLEYAGTWAFPAMG